MKFKVLKDFFYLVDKKNYKTDDIIELSKEASVSLIKNGYISEIKVKK